MERERRVSSNAGLPVRRKRRDPRPWPPPRPWPRPVWLTGNDFKAEGEIDPGSSRGARQPFKSEETSKFGSASIDDKSGKSAIKERNSRVESSLSSEERDQRAMLVQQMVVSIIFNE